MENDPVQAEVRRFKGDEDIARAATPPSSWYTDPAFLDLERRTVFRRNWLAVGRTDQLREPGDYFSGRVLDEPYLVVRGDDGRLRAFFNVCRHHAALLAEGAGRCAEFVCPYHGWTYARDGRLRAAPQLGAVEDFRREDFGLAPLAADTWGPFVFLHFGPDPPPLAAVMAPLAARLDPAGLAQYSFVERRAYDMDCNWKVFVDNYLDGGYHIAHLHHGLAAQLELGAYRTELFERLSIQSCPGDAGPAGERVGREALYAWIHPHFMINRYGDALDTNTVLPLGPGRTRVVFDFWFAGPPEEHDRERIRASLETSEAIQREDMQISAAVQAGLASSGYDRGRYAPALEGGEFHFHRLLAADYAGA